jgi:hypothetical protein
MRVDGAADVKRILSFFRALRASRQPAQDGREACMAIEREYAMQPYPFEWE